MDLETIDRDNYFIFTLAHFEPCGAPEREPDFRSADSSYWFDEGGS